MDTALQTFCMALGVSINWNKSVGFWVASERIRKKLLFWSKVKLSFASRVVVVNQVLLVSRWYIMSCWSFSKSCPGQLVQIMFGIICDFAMKSCKGKGFLVHNCSAVASGSRNC